MTISTGARVGPYEVGAKLGEGGMGEVWRATDARLRRDVALKVLPAGFLADRERLARFEREAQTLAQLQHPNIASIYGLEESNGTRALVMELVEGEDLAARIALGAMPVEGAVAIARQIAEALEAAHEQGIVHRDLKPANVKVRPDGTVKVLDFGLAKAMEPAGAASATDVARSPTLMRSPTLTGAPGTQLGVILGTAAYMAPEQARGAKVDKRADVWAFGVVLHEMLTGERLFAGENVVDTVSAVMREPIDLARLPAGTPWRLRELLRRCLERNPRNRLHDIADARIVLEELERGAREGDAPVEASALAPARARRGLAPAWTATVAALALLAGLAGGWLLRRPASASPAAAARWALAIPDGLSLSTDQHPQIALSQDGRLQIAVVLDSTSTSHLLLRSLDQVEPRLLPDTAGANSPFFSPDGAWIGFFRGPSLVRVPTAGGPPVELARFESPSTGRRGGTWSSDGFLYFASDVTSGLERVSENGGPVTEVTRLDTARDERTHRWPQALPDGSAVLFTCDREGSTEYYDDARIEAVRVATGERHVLVEGASQARYAGGDRLVFARGGSLFSVAFDPRALTVSGAPELAAQGVATDVGSGAVQFALSASGAALWAPGGPSASFGLVWVDRNGAETPAAVPPEPYSEAQLSPDAGRAALIGGPAGAADLWVVDLERGTSTPLTTGGLIASPVWSPDGSRIAYATRFRRGGELRWQIAWRFADGSREAEVLLEDEESLAPSGFTPDGAELLYTTGDPAGATHQRVHLLELTGARERRLLIGDRWGKWGAVVSPDGRWLAYMSTEGGQQNVFVRPFPAGEGRWQVSSPLGMEPRWGPGGRELFYRGGSIVYRVAIDAAAGFSAGRPEPVLDRVTGASNPHSYNPAPDGRIFTARLPAGRGSLRTVHLDLGFAERLAARRSASQP